MTVRPSSSKSSFVSWTIGWARRGERPSRTWTSSRWKVMSSWPSVELGAGPLGDEAAEALGERDAARVDADERDRVEVVVALDDLVGDPRERPLDRFAVQQDAPVRGYGRAMHRTPFRPLWTELKANWHPRL